MPGCTSSTTAISDSSPVPTNWPQLSRTSWISPDDARAERYRHSTSTAMPRGRLLRTEAEMRYYAEGDYSLIRLHAPVDDSSVDAVLIAYGQFYRGGEGWIDPQAGRDLV